MTYEKPTVADYGDLRDVTAAIAIGGVEDGASKATNPQHHSLGLP